jgi:hypothetical protein
MNDKYRRCEIRREVSRALELAAKFDVAVEEFRDAYRQLREQAPDGNLHIRLMVYVPDGDKAA